MTEDQVNEILATLADDSERFEPPGDFYERVIPYLGFYWRDISPSDITLGLRDGIVWIMQNNKWGFPMYWCNEAERLDIYQSLEHLAEYPTQEGINAFYEYLQTYREKFKETQSE